MKINKYEEFTPWEEDHLNLLKIIRSPKLKKSKMDTCRTINHSRQTDRVYQRNRRKSFEREYLSLSKINFHKGEDIFNHIPTSTKNKSKKYGGPRINFYLKMNPTHLKLYKSNKKHTFISIEQESLVSTNTSNAIATHRTIYQQKNINSQTKRQQGDTHLKFVASFSNISNIKRMKDEHRNMKKLRYIYESRINKKN